MYIRKIFNQSLLYGIGNFFSTLFSFLVLPVYTRLLSVQDFGKLSLILTAIFFLQYMYNMGIYSGFMVRYFDFKAEDYIPRKRLSSTILFFYVFFCLLTSVFIYLFLCPVMKVLIGTEDKLVIMFIVLISSFEILYILPMAIMRFEERIITFISISFIKSFMLLVTVFIALRYTNGGINAALLAQLSVTFCATVFAYLLTYRNYAIVFDVNELKNGVKIGLPFLIVMISFWLIDSANKFMINHFLSVTEVALYSIGFKIGQIILFIVTVFQLVWQPQMFKIAADEKSHKIFGEIFNYFTLTLFTIALVISLFSQELILIFSTNTYVSSYGLVPIIVFAYLFYGLFYFLQTPLIIKKHLYSLTVICIIGAIFNIIANFTAIPLFGITGAAYATAITYSMMACIVLLVSQKIYYIPYDLLKFSKIVFAVVFSLTLEKIGNVYLLSGILFKIGLVLLFFVILLILKFFDEKDKFFLREKAVAFRRSWI